MGSAILFCPKKKPWSGNVDTRSVEWGILQWRWDLRLLSDTRIFQDFAGPETTRPPSETWLLGQQGWGVCISEHKQPGSWVLTQFSPSVS